MTAEPREELISAYLDGELSQEQRAEVEKWLADSSQLRRLHAELLAMRSGMQSLERHQLDHDIGGAVLRRAEQSVLRGTDAKSGDGAVRPAPASTSWWSRGASWRRVVWPALAVAAALVILIYDANRRPAEREVARAPAQEELAQAPAREDEMPAANRELPIAREEGARSLEVRAAPKMATDAYRPSESAVEIQRAESPRSQRMLKDLAEPSAGAPAAKSALGSAAMKESFDALPGQMKHADGLVLECTPQFLRDGTFEKLLDEKKIKWWQVDASRSSEKKAQRQGDVDKVDSFAIKTIIGQPGRATYVVDGTPEQVSGILAELGDRVQQRAGPAYGPQPQYESDSPLPPQSAAGKLGEKSGGIRITLVAPAAATPPAAPADESP